MSIISKTTIIFLLMVKFKFTPSFEDETFNLFTYGVYKVLLNYY